MYLGLIDTQVKIRGFRIELGEIEAALLKMPTIKDCVLNAQSDRNGDKYLIAYYIADEVLDNLDIIECLKKTLPEYMIPGFYIKINEIPLTPNGKINRLALPTCEQKRKDIMGKVEYVAPETEVEKKIAKLWQSIFQLDEVGIDDEFFYLGGNSILLSALHIKLEKSFDTEIRVAQLFVNTTIRKQGKMFEEREKISKQVKLDTIQFPSQFYMDKSDSVIESRITTTISKEIYDRIITFAIEADVNAKSVYLVLYFYLLSTIAKQGEIDILYSTDEWSLYDVIHGDLSIDSDLEVLCHDIFKKMQTSQMKIRPIERREAIYKQNEIQPIFVWSQQNDFECLNGNEMKIVISECEDQLQITYIYNKNRFIQSKMEDLLRAYIKLIHSVVDEFR